MTVAKRAKADKSPPQPRSRDERKAENRARIAAAALELFAERGFEGVSVAEVAAAAGVTERTVFNHFPTKEDLVYSQDEAFEAALLDAVRQRPPRTSVIGALRTFLLQTYGRGLPDRPDAYRRARILAGLVSSSPTLRLREREILNRYTGHLRDLLAPEFDDGPDDLRPAVVAGALIAMHQAVITGYRQGLLDDEPADTLERRMVAAATQALDLIADGMARAQRGARRRTT